MRDNKNDLLNNKKEIGVFWKEDYNHYLIEIDGTLYLNEAKLSRFREHSQKGFALISPYLKTNPNSKNLADYEELKEIIHEHGFGYIECYGVWFPEGYPDDKFQAAAKLRRHKDTELTDDELKDETYEKSLFIPVMKEKSYEELRDLVIQLGNKYKQDAIIYGEKGKIYVNNLKKQKVDELETFTPNKIGKYGWTMLRRGSDKKKVFVFEGCRTANSMAENYIIGNNLTLEFKRKKA